ncbi:hypothetical protein KIH74_05845 [Kineosporia sp. J2-2]|uniref:Uncharacterized protein n=1 Tax=Kineosporia corallincola TaxID=2835133 RepID=A0ABS5TBI8_9ACTN|nr:hypothetical protein [Kineosporia corallincola]MBT0768437.1 hypothetical protein [Kineosporia corallincola]
MDDDWSAIREHLRRLATDHGAQAEGSTAGWRGGTVPAGATVAWRQLPRWE